MTINETQDRIIAEFLAMGDSFSQYSYLIEISAMLPAMASCYKTDDKLVAGCQSQVWLDICCENGKMQIQADSNTLVIRGVLAILIELLSGCTPEEVCGVELYIFSKTAIMETFSSERVGGVGTVIKQIKAAAKKWVDT